MRTARPPGALFLVAMAPLGVRAIYSSVKMRDHMLSRLLRGERRRRTKTMVANPDPTSINDEGSGTVAACVSKTPEAEVKLNPFGRSIESWPGSIASANPLPFGSPWPGSNPLAVACSCAVSMKTRSDMGIFVNVMPRFSEEFGPPQKAVGSVDWQPETPELPGVTCRKSLIFAPGCAASRVGPEIPRLAPLKVRSKVANGMVLAVYPLGKTKVAVSENLAVALACPLEGEGAV